MTRERLLLAALVIALAIGGAYLAYDNVLRGDETAALALPSTSPAAVASEAPAASATPATVASEAPAASVDPANDPSADGGVAGTWTVAAGSQAGYRVREQLANLPAESDAVGRTEDVTGSITLVAAGDGAQLAEGSIEIDTTTIRSDEGRRDDRMRREGLETDAFPTATFTITQPIDIPAAALTGEATDLTLVGDLTLHGVTKAVEIPAQAQLVDGRIQVAGSLSFPLSDYDITPPNVGGFIISIADEGALEFLMVFEPA
jgi:polyisoprenoid-binding protein YceI